MIGLKDICAYLLAAGLGAGGVVMVQQVSPPAQVAKGERVARTAARSAAHRAVPAPSICIEAMPLTAPQLALVPLPEFGGAATPWAPAEGPGGVALPVPPGPTFPPPVWPPIGQPPIAPLPPAVPDAPAWALLVAGFGLVGVSLRRRVAL